MIKYKNKNTGEFINSEIFEKIVLEYILELIATEEINNDKIKKIYSTNKNNFISNLINE